MSKELQEEYIRVKDKLDKLQDFYWNTDWNIGTKNDIRVATFTSTYKKDLETNILDTYTLLKSLNKQMYYNEG